MNVSLYQAASALNANSRWQEAIAENMAASSVPGYKRQTVSFKAIEAGMMPPTADTTATRTQWTMPESHSSTSFAPGELRFTGQNTDAAIQGNGFFEVQMPNGGLAYTRDGEFNMNSAGQLVTKSGNLVMGQSGPIQLDHANGQPITISSDGSVSQGPILRGQLKIMNFNKPELLTQASGGLFLPRDPSVELTTVDKPNIRQFYLEQANTSAVSEMANMITVMRASEANQRVIQMQDERMGKAISELGNVN